MRDGGAYNFEMPPAEPADQPLTDEERRAAAASREYFRQNPEGARQPRSYLSVLTQRLHQTALGDTLGHIEPQHTRGYFANCR